MVIVQLSGFPLYSYSDSIMYFKYTSTCCWQLLVVELHVTGRVMSLSREGAEHDEPLNALEPGIAFWLGECNYVF